MSDQCPDPPLDTNCDSASINDQNDASVTLRRDCDSLRRIREHKKARTPTTVVSDAFNFLNDHNISIVDAVEGGSLQTEEQILDKVDIEDKDGISVALEQGKRDSDNYDHLQNEKCLPSTDCYFSKDSGFASLERHLHCNDVLTFETDQDGAPKNILLSQDNQSGSRNLSEPECQSANQINVNHDNNIVHVGVEDNVHDGMHHGNPDFLNESNKLKDVIFENDEVSNNNSDYKIDCNDENFISTHINGTSAGDQDSTNEKKCDLIEGTHGCDSKNDKNERIELILTEAENTDISCENAGVDMRRKPDVIPASPVKPSHSSKTGLLLEANPASEVASDDSSDEDVGIYAESFRRSNWIRVSGDRKRSVKKHSPSISSVPFATAEGSNVQSSSPIPSDGGSKSTILGEGSNGIQDDVFADPLKSGAGQMLCHKRSDSVTTTDSEHEFKTRYISRRKCLIQRADSQQEYHRLSARIYEEDKEVILERTSESEDLGLHILDSHPTYITSVDAGSPAEKAGIVEGQILVTVNDLNVLSTDHNDIIKLIQECKGPLKLGVASTDFQPIRDLQAPVISGHMYKLGTSSLVRIWKKRYFVLRNDNCLYYYKSDQDLDPLGALPLVGYTISRHTDTSKDFCFKAEKYRARTYYFMTENRDQLTQWVGILTEAVSKSKKQKESSSFMSVSSHNVSLPALDIRRPECSGYLVKLSPHSRSWQRRYCLLKDACIYYYKDVNSFSALGVAHLHGYTVDVAGHGKKKNSFSLRPPDAKMRQFMFAADNETDKKRWVEAIIHSIQRWVPVERGESEG